MMKNVYLINETDYIVAKNAEEAKQLYTKMTEAAIENVEPITDKNKGMWDELSEYTKEYITSKSIVLDFDTKEVQFGTLTVGDGVLLEWKKMSDVISNEDKELPYLLMSKE